MRYLPILFALFFAGTAESATRYVNPSHPQSTNSGAGSSTAPYKTISYAMNQLVSGDRLVIAAGTYRESLNPKWRAQNLVIEGSPGTMIKGSDIVTGWVSAGGGLFVRRNWLVNSQQVFVNGVSYQQIGGAITSTIYPSWWPGRIAGGLSSMRPNSFYYDAVGRNLYIKPADGTVSGKTVEVSVRQRAGIGTELNNIQFKNLSFMHSNTSATVRGGAVHYIGSRLVLDNISVTRADSIGIALDGDYNVLSNSVSNYNGQLGIIARGRYVKLINNETSYNNTRGFMVGWEAGGAKFMGRAGTSPSGLMDSVVSGHKALYNNGTGLWLDYNSGGGNKILNNVSAYNQTYGIHFEMSQGVQIYNNLVYGNKRRGIYLATASNALVAHNLVVNNGWEGIIMHNDRRTLPGPRNNQVIGNLVGWNGGKCLFMGDTSLNNKANGNLYLDNQLCKFGLERGLAYLGATGLPQWKSVSGVDLASWEKIASQSSSYLYAISAQQPNVNWSSLKTLASQYKAPPTPLDSGLPPGPINYSLSAPVTTTATVAAAPTTALATQTTGAAAPATTAASSTGTATASTASSPVTTASSASVTASSSSTLPTIAGSTMIPVAMVVPAITPAAVISSTTPGNALTMLAAANAQSSPVTIIFAPAAAWSADRYYLFPLTSRYSLSWQRGDFRTFFIN